MSLISDLPGVAAIDAEIAENARLLEAYAGAHARQVDEYDAAIARRETEVSDALSRGALPPDPPPEPASDAEHQDRLVWFRNRHSMFQERRLAAVASGASTIELKTDAAYADAIEQAKKPVGTLKRLAAQVAELQNCRHEVLCAVIATDPSRGMGASRPPSPARPDAASVVQAVVHGLNLLSAEPVRRLGLQASNLHEVIAPTRDLEPKAGRSVQRTHQPMSWGGVDPRSTRHV